MYVIGTAGHVDHGKSTLIKALTGIDPDRLPQEKEREMTIDLGFAWMTLPSGREVSIVDVPGHERFVKNMLAGVGGIDVALLVVAADEGVMPQTREHLAILELLRIKKVLVVITKADLADDEVMQLVSEDVDKLLEGAIYAGAEKVAVSARTGQGLDLLKQKLDRLLETTQARADLGRPRLPIDRSFTVAGFGTVVTGTLVDGTLSLGQEVELVISGIRCRVRGLQSHRRKLEKATPGRRLAVNLSGVSHDQVRRGEVLSTPGWLQPTQVLDAHITAVRDLPHPLKHGEMVTFHAFTQETLARVRLLDTEQVSAGQEAWAQIHLEDPLAVVKGDFFIIRASDFTIGGGKVADPYPKRHRRFVRGVLERLALIEQGTQDEVLLNAIEHWGPADLDSLSRRTNLPLEEMSKLTQKLASSGHAVLLGDASSKDSVLWSAQAWKQLVEKASSFLQGYHSQHPLRVGAPKEELRSRLGLSQTIFNNALQRLMSEKVLVERGPQVSLPEHRVTLTPPQRRQADEFLNYVKTDRYSPPTDRSLDAELLEFLVSEGKVVRVGSNIAYPAEVYQEMVERIIQMLKEKGNITVAEVRDMFNNSRKYTIALLDHLDEQHITRRVGEERVLIREPAWLTAKERA